MRSVNNRKQGLKIEAAITNKKLWQLDFHVDEGLSPGFPANF